MTTEEIALKVTYDGGEANAGFDTLKEKQGEVEEGAKKVSDEHEKLNKWAERAGKALGAYFAAWASIDFVKRGAEVGDVREGFDKLTESAGALSDTLLNELKKATGGTITDVDLMRKATEQMRAGLKPDELILVTNAARALAEQVGGELGPELDALTFSLIKGDDRFLKTRGVIIDNAKAYDNFAKSIGTTSDKLNEQGKAEAMRAATLETLRAKVDELGVVSNDSADNLDSMSVALSNARDRAAEAISNNEDLNRVLSGLAKTLNEIDFTPYVSGLSKAIEIATGSVKETIGAIEDIGKFFGNTAVKATDFIGKYSAGAAELEKGIRKVQEALNAKDATSAKTGLDDLLKVMQRNVETVGPYKDQVIELGSRLRELTQSANTAAPATQKLTEELKKGTNESDKLNKPLGKNDENVKKYTTGVKSGAKETKTFAEQVKELAKKFKDQSDATELLNGEKGFKGTNERVTALVAAFRTGMIDISRFTEEISKLSEEFVKAGSSPEALLAALSKFFEAGEKEAEEGGLKLGEIFYESFTNSVESKDLKDAIGGKFEGAFDSVATEIGSLLGKALTEGADSEDVQQTLASVGAAIGGAIGFAIGAYFGGPVGGAAGAAIGTVIGEWLGRDFKKNIRKINDAIKDLFFGSKWVVPMVAITESFVGDDTAGTEFRKSIDKFFADAFNKDRLLVVINGQLKQITDLEFGGIGFGDRSKGFFDVFDGLGDAAKGAFAGVAQGFTELLGLSQEFALSVAAALTNNIGGSINNLQLLVQASGVSVEQLKESIVGAMLDGKLSFIEAHTALIGIQRVAEKGIPDGVGFTVEAFENLKAAGIRGGRASTDALRDIADEAKELHLKDFPALMQQMVASGKLSAAEVAQLFETLKKYGIDSIEELSAATDEQLIPVLADLENQKFPFADATKDAQELMKAVEELPEKIRTKLVFDVETNMDSNTQQAMEAKVYEKAQVQVREVGQREGIR